MTRPLFVVAPLLSPAPQPPQQLTSVIVANVTSPPLVELYLSHLMLPSSQHVLNQGTQNRNNLLETLAEFEELDLGR